MGRIMGEDDIHIGTLLDAMNHSFAPAQLPENQEKPEDYYGGIAELASLQREFGIFQEGRTFSRSMSLLGMGGMPNRRAHNRWLRLLEWLTRTKSTMGDLSGDAAIVKTIIENVSGSPSLPIHFTHHPAGADPTVKISGPVQSLHYVHQDFIQISLPLEPRPR